MVLMKFKDENYKLKIELNDLKKKNEFLEKTVDNVQKLTINTHQNYLNTNETIDKDVILLLLKQHLSVDDNKKDNNDIIDRLLCLNIECKSKLNASKHQKATDIINAIVQLVDIQRFYKDFKLNNKTNNNQSTANVNNKQNNKIDISKSNTDQKYKHAKTKSILMTYKTNSSNAVNINNVNSIDLKANIAKRLISSNLKSPFSKLANKSFSKTTPKTSSKFSLQTG